MVLKREKNPEWLRHSYGTNIDVILPWRSLFSSCLQPSHKIWCTEKKTGHNNRIRVALQSTAYRNAAQADNVEGNIIVPSTARAWLLPWLHEIFLKSRQRLLTSNGLVLQRDAQPIQQSVKKSVVRGCSVIEPKIELLSSSF